MKYISRIIDLKKTLDKKSCFLFGPRQTGKSHLISHVLSEAKTYNLLDGKTFLEFSQSPNRLVEEVSSQGFAKNKLVVIDEIQKLPSLLDQVHLLIESKGMRFLLTGSSARKLRQGGVNLLGGRARSKYLHPLIYQELKSKFDLTKALNRGLLPSIYFSDDPQSDLQAYAGDYLKEEVAYEGISRNIPAFSRFLEVASLCNAKMVNYTEIGNDAQVSRALVTEYFQILKDTLLGCDVLAWKESKKRKPIGTHKFYFFDIGVVRILQKRDRFSPKTPEFGDAFETWLFHELKSFTDYKESGEIAYWRSTSGFEVDFILSNRVAIEAKGKEIIQPNDLKGLKALMEEKLLKHYILVCCCERPRTVDGILILPWKLFLEKLWAGDFN